MCDIPVVRVTN